MMDMVPDAAFAGRDASGVLDESKITSKGQLTLPKTVRAALGVAAGDRVRFVLREGQIIVEAAAEVPLDDPALGAFLDVLENSLSTASDFPAEVVAAMQALTAEIEVDLEAPIDGDVVI